MLLRKQIPEETSLYVFSLLPECCGKQRRRLTGQVIFNHIQIAQKKIMISNAFSVKPWEKYFFLVQLYKQIVRDYNVLYLVGTHPNIGCTVCQLEQSNIKFVCYFRLGIKSKLL